MATAELLTVKEVAKRLGITDARVRQLCIEYEIGSIVGNTRVLNQDDLERLDEIRSTMRTYKKSG